jgi:hypothetical protein
MLFFNSELALKNRTFLCEDVWKRLTKRIMALIIAISGASAVFYALARGAQAVHQGQVRRVVVPW